MIDFCAENDIIIVAENPKQRGEYHVEFDQEGAFGGIRRAA